MKGYIVDQVPIEQIEPGDTMLSHLPDGSTTTFVVGVKVMYPAKGVRLEAAADSDTHGVGLVPFIEAALGTLTHRVIGKDEAAGGSESK